MNNRTIAEIWEQNELILEDNRKLNMSVVKEIKFSNIRQGLKGMLFLPVSTLTFFFIAASYATYFMIVNAEKWYFVFSGALVVLFSLLYVVSSINQLKHLLSINYSLPITRLQKHLIQLKLHVVKNLRIAAYLLPFGPFIGLFLPKALLNVNLIYHLDYSIFVSFGVVTILLEVLSLVALKALNKRNMNKNWLNWLLMGNGSQVTQALQHLEEIEELQASE